MQTEYPKSRSTYIQSFEPVITKNETIISAIKYFNAREKAKTAISQTKSQKSGFIKRDFR
jgi:hypothetical protein